ncbi:uncharacterized protein LOC106657752 [Trichogramma pretiosum]|uniref:uncharacterized protein LOC106657752 n=1 Tax=Trichogramma pretiosum TaxID=7493 RepID=UPI000C71A88B|nr:uncharacterized protein LOC106657752 [Trichogramma pretiosum]
MDLYYLHLFFILIILFTFKYSQKITTAIVEQRQTRFFPFFNVIRFSNSACTSKNYNGTCYSKKECTNYGGADYGSCANGFGTCCVFEKTCGTSTIANTTYFTSPSYPKAYVGGSRCFIQVQKYNTDICQLRLDFIDFTLAQPSFDGICNVDSFLITGGSSHVPQLCGENTDQHVYIDFDGSTPITISIDTKLNYTIKRRWNIKIQQIFCFSELHAPRGCLQHHTSVSGSVISFNYGSFNSLNLNGTREIAQLNYGICITKLSGYCILKWSATDFGIASYSSTNDTVSSCRNNFIMIPNSKEIDTNPNHVLSIPTDRFCGENFVPRITNLSPFVLYVVTDSTAIKSSNNQSRGFIMNFEQKMCLDAYS